MTHAMKERDYLLQIIQEQLRRHSGFEVEDLYKIVHQTTCGGDHLLKNKTKAKKVLKGEWKNLGKIQKGEPLLEMIDPRGEIVRVNLRVYRKIGGTVQHMFNLFVQSAQEFRKDQSRLSQYWKWILALAEKEDIPFSRDVLQDFWIKIVKQEFPTIHHSTSYADANQPAYRVILKRLWEGIESGA